MSSPIHKAPAANSAADSNDLVRLLLNSTGEGIYGIDLDGCCTFANPSCARLLGFDSPDDLLGKHMHDLVHHTRPNGDPYPAEECRIYQAFRKNKGTNIDDELLYRRDGSSFPTEYWSYPVEREGELVGCVVTFVDITERLQVAEELRQIEKMAALGKLSAGLAHELNNPAAASARAADQLADKLGLLQSAMLDLGLEGLSEAKWSHIAGWYQQIREKEDTHGNQDALALSDEEEILATWLEDHSIEEGWNVAPEMVAQRIGVEDLNVLAGALSPKTLGKAISWVSEALAVEALGSTLGQSAQRISELVDAVKSYSRLDQAAIQYVDIHRGIEDTLIILGHKLHGKIEVVRQYDRNLQEVQVRASELNQVWTNLIDNAIDAVGDAGTITVRTYVEQDGIGVDISDDGPGISEEVQVQIFDPFFTTKDVGHGTGLGLDIARRIVTARCDGKISVRSVPGDTTFTVYLPNKYTKSCERSRKEQAVTT